ncbi:hypothetical protein AKJ37_04810 [candidate division MSBL1 archaeon SCGC-AAA259I09]|uniref:4Fe-4S ferredoxin-type domain-containing protein n=1 Tax=candidate division MSBL1 archaeon SCGC-AAA259I09 TaxID=1698267 RepID=A0A133UR48_9EURY|nr:hypothetical protein AKJ37_04810 [candidate division MSBL1 archaeon SCGC-AAA259I09]
MKNIILHPESTVFGVAPTDRLSGAPEGHQPEDILPDSNSVVVLGLKMLDAQMELQSTGGDYYSRSLREKMIGGHISFISLELDRMGYKIATYLEREGFKTFHQLSTEGGVDDRYLLGLMSLKHAAEAAGIGVFGKNSLLLTPEYGPRVRLTAILTDAEIESDKQLSKDLCQECRICIETCPAEALSEPEDNSLYQIDKFLCCNSRGARASCRECLTKCPVGKNRSERFL